MTTDADSIDRIIALIAERDPAFPNQIQGATSAEIDRLEQAIGTPISDGYRRFLERMGRSSSWLTLAAARFDIDSVTRFFGTYGNHGPANHLLIGRGEGDPRYDFYLLTEAGGQERIVSFDLPYAPDRIIRTAGSLPQWMGDRALFVLRRQAMPHQKRFSDPRGTPASRLDQFDRQMLALGAAPLWYSNDWMRTYETPQAVVTVFEVPVTYRMIVSLSAATAEETDRLMRPLKPFVRGIPQ